MDKGVALKGKPADPASGRYSLSPAGQQPDLDASEAGVRSRLSPPLVRREATLCPTHQDSLDPCLGGD